MTEPHALVALAVERMDERLFEESVRAARRHAGWVHEMHDAELIGLAAVIEREMGKRGFAPIPPKKDDHG